MRYFNILYLMSAIILLIGCSNSNQGPIVVDEPDVDIVPAISQPVETPGHALQGIYTVTFDPEKLTARIEPNRELGAHFNVRPFIPTPGISVTGWNPLTQTIGVNVTVRNPYAITGYDVRVIIYTDSVGHMLVNHDNWTALYDIPGGGTINPFKAYAKTVPSRAFIGPVSHMENLQIVLPGGNVAVNFAIDASYPSNCGEPYQILNFVQQEPLYDRPPSSAVLDCVVNSWDPGGALTLEISCPEILGAGQWDFQRTSDNEFTQNIQNEEDADAGEYTALLTAYTGSPIMLYEYVTLTVLEKQPIGWARDFPNDEWIPGIETDQDGYIYFGLNDTNRLVKYNGVPESIWVRDMDSLGYLEVIHDLSMSPFNDFLYASAYAYYCGTSGYSGACTIKSPKSTSGGTYFAYQCFYEGVGSYDIVGGESDNSFVSSGDRDFGHIWAITKFYDDLDVSWTNQFVNYEGSLFFEDILYSNSHTIYAIGKFRGTYVDIDPTDGAFYLFPGGYQDALLTEWNSSNGSFMEVRVWGGYYDDIAMVEADIITTDSSSNVFVGGRFKGTVDFNPDFFTTDIKTSTGDYDIYISKFNSDLTFQRSITLDGDDTDYITGMATDSSGNIYIAGYFSGTVDFDPGSGSALKTSLGSYDAFLAKYSNNLGFIWVRTWGTVNYDWMSDVAIDKTNDYVYISGTYYGTMDFDPGPEVYEMTSGDLTAFIMKLLPTGYWD